ncbi:MAG: PilN domain-containing protein [Candidatus Omnitrophica bacterium]|nr:PilN domain-containing protein [Candidatus Omnitrophota bacterium]
MVERKASPVKASSFQTETLSLFKDINLDYRLIMLGVGICVAVFGFGLSQVIPLKQKINNVIAQRISVANVDAEASYEKLTGVNLEYKRKLEELDNLIKKQLYLTQTLDTIPRSIPAGVWLTDFFLNKGQNNATELSLQGMSYLADSDKEFEAVNSFLSNLRANPDFSKYFTEINISSIDHRQVDEKVTATSFVITARNNQEKR